MGQELIAQLAKEMNVSEADVKCLAQSVANSMVHDKCEEQFKNADSTTQSALTEAYVSHANKKFQAFQAAYLANPEARAAFIAKTYNELAA